MAEDVVKSAGRVFAMLELFDREGQPLSAGEVERTLGFPQSSTLALLKTMVRLGYLAYDALSRTYAPTLRLAQLGNSADGLGMDVPLDELMAEISDATGEAVVISCQNDLEMQYLKMLPGRSLVTLNIKPGEHAPLFNSAIGFAALSRKSNGDIARLADRINRKPKEAAGPVALDEAMAAIERVRRDGFSIGYGLYVETIGAICWPLPDNARQRQLVLSVGGALQSIRRAEASIIASVTRILHSHNYGMRP